MKNLDDFSSKLSAKIWGHRFKDGQRGPEYVLEFLNVLFGTNYALDADGYNRNKAENLRKFIFEGVKEGSKRDTAKLKDEQKRILYEKISNENKVEVIREFFRNLEVPLVDGRGKEADRSWYARSLYPLHESLLFFELRVKSGSPASYERNFFARGGELYYLMISYGTEKNPKLRNEIESRFKELLTKNNSIGKIVDSIQSALGDSKNTDVTYPLKQSINSKEYPHLPLTESDLFDSFAIELNDVLSLDIDTYDMFKLLISLTCFQLMRYMYEQSKIEESYQIQYFFDCLDGKNEQIQKLSSKTFKNNELLVKNKFEHYFNEQFHELIGNEKNVKTNLSMWKENPEEFVNIMNLQKLQSRKKRVINTLAKCNTYEDVTSKLFNVVNEVISDSLKRHQLSIIRTLARDGGIGNFKSGSNYRYIMTDDFLQTLVFINVRPNESIEFSDFISRLYNSYGFVIGEVQARKSGLYKESKLNISYYQKNELALREKLRKNGLLVEYSDATAMIHNPYDLAEGVAIV
ncbi:hypothetical protein [Metabacillus dongyingensis]|uniref:hypothetical protein n=1 Tax=Metabacillus dongyingensis TaxID=2874282 RepID=UPI001CBE276F|nr:hypothetical protein [Metabacillus dongyingensis]